MRAHHKAGLTEDLSLENLVKWEDKTYKDLEPG